MSSLTQEELMSVIADAQAPAVSIFLPVHRAGPDIQQDPIRLKNLLKQAEHLLIAEGSRPVQARELLAPVSDLLDEADFWRHQEDGLAILRSPKIFRVYRLPLAFDELCSVSERFYVKPLLPLLINEAPFYILALSHNNIRLLECSLDRWREVQLPALPQGMQEGLPIGPAPQFQRYTLPAGGPHGRRFHGHGIGIDDSDVANLTRYFHRVNDELMGTLKDRPIPLILACVDYLVPIFKQVSSYQTILEPHIAGNPDGLSNEELHRKAWSIAQAHFHRSQDAAVAEYREGLAKGRAGNKLQDVLPAAYQGRIATLFVPLGIQRWGRFDFNRLTLEEHEEEQTGDDELVNLAAMETLIHAGNVYGVKPDEMPDRQLLAAVYRY
jgi:Bacterial archaeo-eukaryotic release factor family 7